MKESDTIRLVRDFILSIGCAAPYVVVLTKTDKSKLNTVIRKATKQTLGLT